jgi:hypothetical protein
MNQKNKISKIWSKNWPALKRQFQFRETTKEEFLEFMENLFANVDDEDRHDEVTLKTSMSFKMIGELVDVLIKFGEIPNEWQQRSNSIII